MANVKLSVLHFLLLSSISFLLAASVMEGSCLAPYYFFFCSLSSLFHIPHFISGSYHCTLDLLWITSSVWMNYHVQWNSFRCPKFSHFNTLHCAAIWWNARFSQFHLECFLFFFSYSPFLFPIWVSWSFSSWDGLIVVLLCIFSAIIQSVFVYFFPLYWSDFHYFFIIIAMQESLFFFF